MKFREHRGGLEESMKTVVDVADRAALEAHVRALLEPFYIDVPDGSLRCVDMKRIDSRIGWRTHLISLPGYGVVGMTDGPL